MKRTTILLPDDLAYVLDRERRRRGVSAAAIVREAVAAHFNLSDQPRRLGFVGLGSSGLPDLGQNDERYLDEGWGSAEFYEQTMGRPREETISNGSTERRQHPAGPGVLAMGDTVAAAANADVSRDSDRDQAV